MTRASTFYPLGPSSHPGAPATVEFGPSNQLRNADDFRERIALAVSAGKDKVRVERYGCSHSGLAARCSGSWNGKRFFGKVLLADPYPVPPRFSPPWEEPAGVSDVARPVEEQIETEWEMTLKMRSLSDGLSVPLLLGKSLPARTIVWEEAAGSRLDKLLTRSRWQKSNAAAGVDALFQAGKWIRFVQTASNQGAHAMNGSSLARTAVNRLQPCERAASNYERVAVEILKGCAKELGGMSELYVPLTFAHGDFCLPNLLWDSSSRQLAVIDFELSGFRPAWSDLFAIVSDLRANLLNPLIPKQTILTWEETFWRGYGPIPEALRRFIRVLASARIFYHDLARLLTRKERKGRLAGLNAWLYRQLIEPAVITRRLDLPPEYVLQ